MVKENSRKDNEQKLFKNFSSKEEMQRMRESVSADVLYQENYKFFPFNIPFHHINLIYCGVFIKKN